MKKEIILKGNGFTLRHIRMSDAQAYFECVGDKKLKQALINIPENVEEVKKEIKIYIADFKKKKPLGEAFVIEVNGIVAG